MKVKFYSPWSEKGPAFPWEHNGCVCPRTSFMGNLERLGGLMTRSVVVNNFISGAMLGAVTYQLLSDLTPEKKDMIDDMITGVVGDIMKDFTGQGMFGSFAFIIPSYFKVGNIVADFVAENTADTGRRLIASIGVGLFCSTLGLVRHQMQQNARSSR